MSVVDQKAVVSVEGLSGGRGGAVGEVGVVDQAGRGVGGRESGVSDAVSLVAFCVVLGVMWLMGRFPSEGLSFSSVLQVLGPACLVAVVCGAGVSFVQSVRR